MIFYDVDRVPQAERQEVAFVGGLDLARQVDASALSCLACRRGPDGRLRFGLVYLDRWWSSYPNTHARVLETISREPLAGRLVLAVDSTGPGLSWYEGFEADPRVRALMGGGRLVPVSITSGRAVTRSGPYLRVGKHRLITELHAALGDALTVSKGLPLLGELARELDGFEGRVRATGYLAFGNNAKVAAHDDLVVSVALALVAARVAFGEISTTSAP